MVVTNSLENPSSKMSTRSETDRKYERRYATLLVLSISLLIINIDDTVVNIAIPTLQRQLVATMSELQWIVTAYILVFAGLLLTMGSLGDRFGRKRTLQLGLAIFGVASVLAAYSSGSLEMIGARAVMGLGAALIMPSTLSVLTDVFPKREREKAIGIWTGVASLGLPLGPLLGGWLLQTSWWGSIFLINVPIVSVALVAGIFLVPESRSPNPRRLDLAGMAMSTVALAGLLYGIIGFPQLGWSNLTVIASFAAAAVFGLSFVVHEGRTDQPMLDLALFRSRRLSFGATTITLTFLMFAGLAFVTVQYLQIVRGLNPLMVGALFLPLIAAVMVGAGVSPRFGVRLGVPRTIGVSFVVLALGMLGISNLGLGTSLLLVSLVFVPVGFSLGSLMVPSTSAIMEEVPRDDAGVGSSLNDLARQVGAALGVSLLGSILAWAYSLNMGSAINGLNPGLASAASNSIGGASSVAVQLGGPAGQLLLAAAFQSFIEAFRVVSILAAIIAVVSAVGVVRFMPSGQGLSVNLVEKLAAEKVGLEKERFQEGRAA